MSPAAAAPVSILVLLDVSLKDSPTIHVAAGTSDGFNPCSFGCQSESINSLP